MKMSYSTIVVLLIFFLFSFAQGAAVSKQGFESSWADNPEALSRFLNRVDKISTVISDEKIDELKVLSLAWGIESRIKVILMNEIGVRRSYSPAERARAARQFLTPERYVTLEKFCLAQLISSQEKARILAMHLLTQSLGSEAGKNILRQRFLKGMEILQGDDEAADIGISPEELFALAEALAFLKDSSGIFMLESAFDSDNCPSDFKQRAIKAVAYLECPISDTTLTKLLESKDAAVVYTAFDCLREGRINRVFLSSAIQQLNVFSEGYHKGQKLSSAIKVLLLEVSSVIIEGIRQEYLSQNQIEKVKYTVNYLVSIGDEEVQARVGSIFAELADDGDYALIVCLLKSKSSMVRECAALALAKCSPQNIRKQKEVLLELLDDKSGMVRNFALYALRTGLGEKTGNFLPDKEYEIQKDRVRKAYETINSRQ